MEHDLAGRHVVARGGAVYAGWMMKAPDAAERRLVGAVHTLIPMVHVADVEASLAFYALLGFEAVGVMREAGGAAFWARARSGQGEIMFARASGPIEAGEQAVLFYMYSDDVVSLRDHLLLQGLHEGGVFCGSPGPNGGRRVVFSVTRPHYMPAGEMRVVDGDGYVILVGQLG